MKRNSEHVARVWVDAGWYFASESRKTRQARLPAQTMSKAERKRQAVIAERDNLAEIRAAMRAAAA